MSIRGDRTAPSLDADCVEPKLEFVWWQIKAQYWILQFEYLYSTSIVSSKNK